MQKFVFILFALPGLVWAGESGPDSKWVLNTVEDASGFGSIVALQQDSAKTIKDDSAANDVIPRLEFRCSPGDTAVTARIDWQRFISSFSTEVGFKIDGGRFTWLKWKVDSSEQVTISPSAEDSQKLLEVLKSGTRLLVEISPYSQGPVTAEYDVTGFSDALESLRGECR
jgi:hypothetical protein